VKWNWVIGKEEEGLGPRGLHVGGEQTGMLDILEQSVFRKDAIELFGRKLVFATFEREHVPPLVLSVEYVDSARGIIVRDHLQDQHAFRGLNPTGSDRFANLQERGDRLFERTRGPVLPIHGLVNGHLSQAWLHTGILLSSAFWVWVLDHRRRFRTWNVRDHILARVQNQAATSVRYVASRAGSMAAMRHMVGPARKMLIVPTVLEMELTISRITNW
jgi:hypothetical protein